MPSYRPLLDLIASGEGGYTSVNRGRAGDTPGGMKDLTNMSLGQIMSLQSRSRGDSSRLFAVGRYQMIPSTLRSAVSGLGLSSSEKFTPEIQDKLATWILQNKRSSIGDYVSGRSGNEVEAAQDLAREFASIGLAYPEAGRRVGESRYSGSAGNAASISPDAARRALREARGYGSVPLSNLNPTTPIKQLSQGDLDARRFLESRSSGASISGLDAAFASRLTRAIRDGEAATGERARITSGYRSVAEQREIRRRFGYTSDDQPSGHNGLPPAARPGSSRHQSGLGVDIGSGKLLTWLHQNANRYDLEKLDGELGRRDPFHIQMSRSDAAGINLSGEPTGGAGFDGSGHDANTHSHNDYVQAIKDDDSDIGIMMRQTRGFMLDQVNQTKSDTQVPNMDIFELYSDKQMKANVELFADNIFWADIRLREAVASGKFTAGAAQDDTSQFGGGVMDWIRSYFKS